VDVLSENAATIARRFLSARREARGLADYPGELPQTLGQAYAVQDAAIAAWARPVIGWKVGRIHPPHTGQLGADRLAGPIFAASEAPDGRGTDMPVFAEGFVAAEAEYLLRLGRTPPAGQRRFSLDETADLIEAVHVGIEIASSPLGRINALGPVAVVSDFGNNNGLVVGPAIADWRTSGFEDWTVTTRLDGVEVGSGRASAFPDGALGAARFLLELMAERGIALAPGQWISSGAVSGVHDAAAGQAVEAVFDDRFTVSCGLKPALPE
jgi:2-keto-4-pentenoate hydratase